MGGNSVVFSPFFLATTSHFNYLYMCLDVKINLCAAFKNVALELTDRRIKKHATRFQSTDRNVKHGYYHWDRVAKHILVHNTIQIGCL